MARPGSTATADVVARVVRVAAGALAVAWAAILVESAPPGVLAAALVPAALWIAALVPLARRAGVSGASLAAAFLWGAVVAAPASSELNQLAPGALAPWAAAVGDRWRSVALGPVVEELAKAAIVPLLLLAPRRGGSPAVAGMVYAAASGLGFAATENASYLLLATLHGGLPGLLVGAWSRAVVAGAKHAVFAAAAGAGIGWAIAHRSAALRASAGVLVGLGAAVAQHAAWNGLVAPRLHAVLCRAAADGLACVPSTSALDLLVLAPALTVVALAPGAAALAIVRRREASARGDLRREAAA